MSERFADALKVILVYEGGKVDDPRDPGGRTNQGITQRVFNTYLVHKGKPKRDVYTLTDAERDDIYRQQYASRIHFDELPEGVDLVVFDGAVNSGVAQSLKWLQRALGCAADGVWGLSTKTAVENFGDYDLLVARILAAREKFLRALKTFRTFGKGWMRRLDNLKRIGQSWASGSGDVPAPVSLTEEGGHKKASLADAKAPPARAPADALASGGVVSTGLTTIQTTLEPLNSSVFVQHVLVGVAVASAIAVAAGLVWGWYSRRKKAELEDALNLTPAVAANENEPVRSEEEVQAASGTEDKAA